jgi:cation:H+ antiporter
MLDYLLFALGIAAVLLGSQWLVAGASRLAADFGVPPFIIGATIVGFGTSAPEMVIGSVASAAGDPGTALGNVVGSNIANAGLVLGTAALLTTIRPDRLLLARDGPILIGLSLLVLGMGLTGTFERWFGLLLLAGFVAYVVLSVRWGRAGAIGPEEAEESVVAEGIEEEWPSVLRDLGMVAGGIALLAIGAPVLVSAVRGIAEQAGIPEFVIAATLIAIGTSIPELATAVVAARRGKAEIAVGNVVGSNIFNIVGVLGIAATIRPIPVDQERGLDLVVMVLFAIFAVGMSRTGRRLPRTEGAVLLAAYFAFLAFLLVQ